MGISEEMMKELNAPEEIRREALKIARPGINAISLKMINDLHLKLEKANKKLDAKEFAKAQAKAKDEVVAYLVELQLRRFIEVNGPIKVDVSGTHITIEPNPFQEPANAEN